VAAPVDTVTLSQAAQQSLATAAGAAPAASPAVDPSQPDDVTQAIATLNDTSGNVSASDQWNAFALLSVYVAGGPQEIAWAQNAVATGKFTSPPPDVYTAAKGNAIVALIDSPFGQRVEQDEQQVGTPERVQDSPNGDALAASVDASTAAFNSLSTTDQQIYVNAADLSNQLEGEPATLATPADFVAYQNATADVDRALQAAITSPTYATALTQTPNAKSWQIISQATGNYTPEDFGNKVEDLGTLAAATGDLATATLAQLDHTGLDGGATTYDDAAWTQQVQAYFAEYGPPPAPDATAPPPALVISGETAPPPDGAQVSAALATVWDTSGNASVTDQIAAQTTVWNYAFSGHADVNIGQLGFSPFQNAANAAANEFGWSAPVQTATSGNANPFTTPSELDLLNAQPLQQQQLIFYGGFSTEYATLDDWKTALAQQDATNKAAWQADQTATATSTASALAAASTAAVASLSAAPASVGLSASQVKQAVAKLLPTTSTDSGAAVALKVLQNVAKANAAYKTGSTRATGATASAPATSPASTTAQTASAGATKQPAGAVAVTA
jgi:hypothetical protein